MDHGTIISILVDLQRAGVQLPLGPALEQVVTEVSRQPNAWFGSVLFALCRLGRHSSLEPPETLEPYDVPIFKMDDYERGSDEVYGEIAERIAAICGGELPIRVVDCSASTLAVALGEERFGFVYEYQDDWVDGTVFDDLAALLVRRGSATRLVHACSVFFAMPAHNVHLLDEVVRRHNQGSWATEEHAVRHAPSSRERLELARVAGW